MKKLNKNILVLPRWYPNKTDVQLGIFIQRQLVLMQNDFKFYVVYAQGIDNLKTPFKIVTCTNYPGLTEHIIYFKNDKGPLKKLINFNRYRKAQKIGLKLINVPISLCHIHVPYRSAMPALKLNKKENIPFLITEHWSGHLNGNYKKKNALDKFLYKKIVKKALKISTVSNALQHAFKENTGFDSTVISNYIEFTKQEPTQRTTDTIEILTVGDLHDDTKGIIGMINAFHKAWEQQPNLRLTIVGGGPDEDRIKDLVKTLPGGIIKLTGRQDHDFVLNAMTKCDFYICNSRYETFGMTVAEALMAGKPVVSSKCGGPEEFLDSNNSILFEITPKYNPDQLDTKLLEAILLMSQNFTSYNPESLQDQIKLRFGRKSVHKKWLDFYTI